MTNMRHLLTSIMAIALCVVGVVYPVYAADKSQLVKAAFLYNFTKFTSWPKPLDLPSQSHINICILGKNTLGDATGVFSKASTSSLKISAKHITSPPSKAGTCHVLYITQSMSGNLESVLRQSANSYALTVSDIPKFADIGGMIGFVKSGNKIRLHINKGTADTAGLKLSAQLLEIADKVVR